MYINQLVHQHMPEHLTGQTHKSGNNLGIRKIDRIYDKGKNQLILMVSTRELLDRDVSAFLKGSRLILEAPIQLDYNKPYRTNFQNGKPPRDYDRDMSLIGFSEIALKPGYHYSVISCQLSNPTLVKIILESRFSFHKTPHFTTKKSKRRK
jgi:hypothetical protein